MDEVSKIENFLIKETFLRWLRDEKAEASGEKKPAKPPGRSGISEDTTAIILRLAKENGWGYIRIQGELKKLGISVAHNTIKKIMIKNGFHPSPGRTKGCIKARRLLGTYAEAEFCTERIVSAFERALFAHAASWCVADDLVNSRHGNQVSHAHGKSVALPRTGACRFACRHQSTS